MYHISWKILFIYFCSDTLSTGECQDVGYNAAQWFSKYLGIECRLCYMAPSNRPRYFTEHSLFGPLGMPGEQVTFILLNGLLNFLCHLDIICQYQFIASGYRKCLGGFKFSSANWTNTNEQVQAQCSGEATRKRPSSWQKLS